MLQIITLLQLLQTSYKHTQYYNRNKIVTNSHIATTHKNATNTNIATRNTCILQTHKTLNQTKHVTNTHIATTHTLSGYKHTYYYNTRNLLQKNALLENTHA
jgi:hypothetical protein